MSSIANDRPLAMQKNLRTTSIHNSGWYSVYDDGDLTVNIGPQRQAGIWQRIPQGWRAINWNWPPDTAAVYQAEGHTRNEVRRKLTAVRRAG